MSRHGGARENDDVARGAGVQAAKGVGLVLLAVIIGIVLLQVVDDGTKAPSNAGAASTTTQTTHRATTTTTSGHTTQTTKAAVTPARPPSQVRVIALNAGAPSGAAKNMHDSLQTKGYTNQQQANTWAGAKFTGNTVYCRTGFEQEAQALAVAVGKGTAIKPWPNPPPPFSANSDCVVAVGAPKA
jgi:hypothetical protein